MKNYLMSSLAIVGAISLIIMACSADNSKNSNSTNAVGKYQIAARGNFIDVLDTETGVVKTYKDNVTGTFQATGTLLLYSTTITQ